MDSEVVKLFDVYFLFVLTLKFIFITQVSLDGKDGSGAHESEPWLSRWSFLSFDFAFKIAWRDTGVNLLQDLFAAARRIEIKAINNVF